MITKKLKYSDYLSRFPNCPSNNFQEVKRSAFRWIHKPLVKNDFLPLSVINEPPVRMLDDDDLMCMAYGLSMFDSQENARKGYLKQYERSRNSKKKEQFVEEKGDLIAVLNIDRTTGISGPSNENGHFTLYEYEGVELQNHVVDFFRIFE